MKYIHTKCKGLVDPRKRVCLDCGKKWSRWSWWFDPRGIRMMREPADFKVQTRQEELTSMQQLIRQRVPGGSYVVAMTSIFKYPRQKWARGLIVGVLAFGLACLLYMWIR